MNSDGDVFSPDDVKKMDESSREFLAYFPAEDAADVKALSKRMRRALYRGLRKQQERHSRKPGGSR